MQRVSSEIEKEFSKYSITMIVTASNALIDLASAINAAEYGGDYTGTNAVSSYEISSLWKRVRNYRDRVLGVYADVLSYITQDGQQSLSANDPTLTKYGNNRISGDIGDLSGLTVGSRDFRVAEFRSQSSRFISA